MWMICQARSWMHLSVCRSGSATMRGELPRLDYVPREAINYNSPIMSSRLPREVHKGRGATLSPANRYAAGFH